MITVIFYKDLREETRDLAYVFLHRLEKKYSLPKSKYYDHFWEM